MINLSIDPPRRFLPPKILHRHVSRRRRFHHRSVHVVRYRQCCFCPASRSRGCALPPLASRRLRCRLAGAVAIAVFLSRPRDGGAALCPLSSATRSRLRRCVARLAGIVDCWVCVGGTALCPLSFAVHRRRWRGVLCLTPLPATAPGPNSVAGVNFALGLPRAGEITPSSATLVLCCSGRHCLHPLLGSLLCFVLFNGWSVGKRGWCQ